MVSWKYTSTSFSSIVSAIDVVLEEKIMKLRSWLMYDNHFLTRDQVAFHHICAFMGYDDLFFYFLPEMIDERVFSLGLRWQRSS